METNEIHFIFQNELLFAEIELMHKRVSGHCGLAFQFPFTALLNVVQILIFELKEGTGKIVLDFFFSESN